MELHNPFIQTQRESQAPSNAAESAMTTSVGDSWHHGIAGAPRAASRADNSPLAAIVIALLLLIVFNINSCRRLIANIPVDLFKIRRRDNNFDDHTASETRTFIFIALLLCVSEGIIAATALSPADGVSIRGFTDAVLGCTMLAALFYMAQLAVYFTIGYVFADKVATRQWVRGFNASMALLSLTLTVPAILTFIYPASTMVMIVVAIILYLGCRILFIIKGFRIFYNKIPSLLYFILYLCAVEIVPVMIIGHFAKGIVLNDTTA